MSSKDEVIKSRHALDTVSPWFFKMPKRKTKLKGKDLEYMHDLSEALLAQATPASSAVLYLIVVMLVSAMIWASIAKVDEVTQAEARVIPSNREQVVNSLEGGILSALLVIEGQAVEQGQPVAQLEPTRFESQYKEGFSREMSLQAAKARARAEALGLPLKFPPELANKKELISNETQNYEARKKNLEESIKALRESQALIANEIGISEKLSAQGLFSYVELSRLKRSENDLKQQITERVNRFRADANSEIVRIDTELGQLKPNLNARLETFNRTTLRAPVKGIVKNIRLTTIGSAVPGSAPIMDIVPVDSKLLFDAKLDPKEVSHIKIGLPVALKLSAYDSAIYGDLAGTVILVSPDTFREDARPTEATAGGYYRVLIESEIDPKDERKKAMKIIPGMIASAQIRTGERTVMHYLMKPLTKAKDAFRER
jgi:multidrug efflux pump subunit AcrA (membrane-fusion protein)